MASDAEPIPRAHGLGQDLTCATQQPITVGCQFNPDSWADTYGTQVEPLAADAEGRVSSTHITHCMLWPQLLVHICYSACAPLASSGWAQALLQRTHSPNSTMAVVDSTSATATLTSLSRHSGRAMPAAAHSTAGEASHNAKPASVRGASVWEQRLSPPQLILLEPATASQQLPAQSHLTSPCWAMQLPLFQRPLRRPPLQQSATARQIAEAQLQRLNCACGGLCAAYRCCI